MFRADTTARSFVAKTVAHLHNALNAPNDNPRLSWVLAGWPDRLDAGR